MSLGRRHSGTGRNRHLNDRQTTPSASPASVLSSHRSRRLPPRIPSRPGGSAPDLIRASHAADRRKFSIIHEDPAALEKLRAEVGVNQNDIEMSRYAGYGSSSGDFSTGSLKNYHPLGSHNRFLEGYGAPKRRRVHLQSADLFDSYSPVQKDRLRMELQRPAAFSTKRTSLVPTTIPHLRLYDQDEVSQHLKNISKLDIVAIQAEEADCTMSTETSYEPITVGIVLSGGPAPGGHNVIAGVFDYIKSINVESRVIGFKGGLDGIFRGDYKEITSDLMDRFRNTGGFDMIWSGRGKVTDEEKPTIKRILGETGVSGLIIVGGDGSNSNAALLAEFASEEMPGVSVIGVPKTIDGDLKNEAIECSFGFDTAAKTYSESIGNLCVDCSIGQGVWHFVRVMGRSASHLVMECAMQTRPNMVLIGEEIERAGTSLKQIVVEIVDLIEARWKQGKHYGVVLVPEGLVEFIPEFKGLMDELNEILRSGRQVEDSELTETSRELWEFLPKDDRMNLLAEREASGYVQVAKIATERLLLYCAEGMLKDRGTVPVKSWNRMHHYFGYEGRCAMPSNFDAEYCYALGCTAGCLTQHRRNGYMAVVKNLQALTKAWQPMGVPFTKLMCMVKLSIGRVPGVRRQLVDLNSEAFETLCKVRPKWKLDDYYRCPGPIQFTGPVSEIRNYVVQPPRESELLAGESEADQELQLAGRAVVPQRFGCFSELQKERLRSIPQLPPLCNSLLVACQKGSQHTPSDPYVRRQIYLTVPNLCNDNEFYLREFCLPSAVTSLDSMAEDDAVGGRSNSTPGMQAIQRHASRIDSDLEKSQMRPTRVGIVFLSRQAPGIQNILWGCYERCKRNKGVCIGFKGVEGLLGRNFIEITDDDLRLFRNQGGSDLLGRGIEHLLTEESKWEQVHKVVSELDLDGLVIVGSSLAVTEATYLAEYLKLKGSKCCIVGVPATASNNLGGDLIEANVGFDTASKLYSSLIGNVLTDAASMPKYWHFVRLMGRQPSNEVVECALQTHPNVVIVAEEYGAAQKTLQQVVEDIADVVCRRAESDETRRNFGAVIIPDGLWHHLPTFRMTMNDVDNVISEAALQGKEREAMEILLNVDDKATAQEVNDNPWLQAVPGWSLAVWKSLPPYIRQELLSADKELRFTYVETERLLSQMVAIELQKRKVKGEYKGVFQCVCHYFGYQGRSAMPSVFDATLGFVHGHLATMCVEARLNGHLTTIRGLCGKISSWKLGAIPFNCLLSLVPAQQTNNLHPKLAQKDKAESLVVANAEIQLTGKAFRWLKIARNAWAMQDRFCNPGPIQFWGPAASYYHRILHEEQAEYSRMLQHTQKYAQMLKDACDFGVDEQYLKFVFTSLHGLLYLRHHPDNLVEDIGRLRPRHHPRPYEDIIEDSPQTSESGEDSEFVAIE